MSFTMRPVRRVPRTLVSLVATGVLVMSAGCGGSGGSGGSPGTPVAVRAGDTTCVADRTQVPAGKVTFAVTVAGTKTNELYVYARADGGFTKVVGEAENIGPGTSRDLSATLAAGSYELACKPGGKGDGIRVAFTVTG